MRLNENTLQYLTSKHLYIKNGLAEKKRNKNRKKKQTKHITSMLEMSMFNGRRCSKSFLHNNNKNVITFTNESRF